MRARPLKLARGDNCVVYTGVLSAEPEPLTVASEKCTTYKPQLSYHHKQLSQHDAKHFDQFYNPVFPSAGSRLANVLPMARIMYVTLTASRSITQHQTASNSIKQHQTASNSITQH
jgi:hypothetical protein